MGEMIQKKFREMLDSVSNASDEFVNKYFSNDSVDLDIEVSDDKEEIDDEVEVVKGDITDDWFDYKGNVINNDELPIDDEKSTDIESVKEETVDIKDESIINNPFEEPVVEKETVLEENTSNDDIESTIGNNVDINDIENEIKDNSFDDLNLNYNYDVLEKETNEDNEIKEQQSELINTIEEDNETVKDTQYKKLSGDELIDLLNKIDNGEDFFKEIEV